MNILVSISQNTFREAIRNRVLLVMCFFAILFLGFIPLAGALSPGQENRLITDFGLALIHLFGILLTIYTGSHLIFQEIERKTIFLLISKPVPRFAILLGKFFGLAAVLFVLTLFMSVLFFLLVGFSPLLLLVIGFLYLSFLLLLAIVLFFSSFMSPLFSSMSGILLFIAGNLSFSLKFLGEQFGGKIMGKMGSLLYHLFPNFSHLNLKSFVSSGVPFFRNGSHLDLSGYVPFHHSVSFCGNVSLFSKRI